MAAFASHSVPFPVLPKPKTFIVRGSPGLILALQPEEGTVVEAFWATMTPQQSKAVTLRLAECMEQVWDLMIQGLPRQ